MMFGQRLRSVSISMRMATWFGAILFLGWTLFGLAMRLELEHVLTSSRYQTLARRADRLSDLLLRLQSMPAEERQRKYQDFATATGDGLLDLYDADNHRAYPAPTPEASSFPWPKSGAPELFTKVRIGDQHYRVLRRELHVGDQRYVAYLAAPLAGNLRLLNRFTWGLIFAAPVLLLGSALGGYFVCRRALAPVDRIIASVRTISVSNLGERLAVPRTNDELQRLAETFNATLDGMEDAVQRIRQFTANASHELRSPLCVMRTTAEVALLNAHLDEDGRRSLQEIVVECTKAAEMLEELLTLARADSDNMMQAFTRVDMAELALHVYNQASSGASANGHKLLLHCDAAEGLFVQGNASLLQRLAWILLDNAFKYTPAMGLISITVTRRDGQILFEVADSGIGVSEQEMPHVFERFYRTNRAREMAEGSGLGLSIARWIANMHQATLSIHSQPDAGAVLQAHFPISPNL